VRIQAIADRLRGTAKPLDLWLVAGGAAPVRELSGKLRPVRSLPPWLFGEIQLKH
jgi:hypothetical protein